MFDSKKTALLPRFAMKIKELRADRGMTQKELAKEAGISESAMRSYELGDRTPKPEVLDRIARALKVRPEYLSAPEFKRGLEFTYALLENDDMQGYTVTEINGHPAIVANAKSAGSSFAKLLSEWNDMKAKVEAREITSEEYAEWKRTYEGVSWVNTKDSKSPWTGK